MEPPKDYETYIHRSGRTGRAGSTGVCVTMCARNKEDRVPYIEQKAGFKFERIGPPQPAEMAKVAAKRAVEAINEVCSTPAALRAACMPPLQLSLANCLLLACCANKQLLVWSSSGRIPACYFFPAHAGHLLARSVAIVACLSAKHRARLLACVARTVAAAGNIATFDSALHLLWGCSIAWCSPPPPLLRWREHCNADVSMNSQEQHCCGGVYSHTRTANCAIPMHAPMRSRPLKCWA